MPPTARSAHMFLCKQLTRRCHVRYASALLVVTVVVVLAVANSAQYLQGDPQRSVVATPPPPQHLKASHPATNAPMDRLRSLLPPTVVRRQRFLFNNTAAKKSPPTSVPAAVVERSSRRNAFRSRATSALRSDNGDQESGGSEKATPPYQWMPGGVVGPTLLAMEAELATVFDALLLRRYRNRDGVGSSGIGGSAAASPSASSSGVMGNDDVTAHLCRAVMANSSRQDDAAAQDVWQFLSDATAALVALSLRQEDDCRMHLPPHQRAMCFLLAALDDTDCSDGAGTTTPQYHVNTTTTRRSSSDATHHIVPLHNRCAYRESYCSHLATCVQWSRGTFNPPLSTKHLRRVYQERVLPRLVASAGAFELHQQQFLHGEVARVLPSAAPLDPLVGSANVTAGGGMLLTSIEQRLHGGRALAHNMRELQWLRQRLRAQEIHLEKAQTIYTALLQRPPSARRVALSHLEPRAQAAIRAATPTCAVFQGHNVSTVAMRPLLSAAETIEAADDLLRDVTVRRSSIESVHQEYTVAVSRRPTSSSIDVGDPLRRHAVEAAPPGGPSTTLPYLNAEETLSALLQLCEHAAAHRGSVDVAGTPADGEHHPVPPACVLLFHGDSLARETFTRLILHIRYGVNGVVVQDRLHPPTHIEVGIFNDIVYRLFPTHDEIILLENNATIHKAPTMSFKPPSWPPRGGGNATTEGIGSTTSAGSSANAPNNNNNNRAEWTLLSYLNDLVQFSKLGRQAMRSGRQGRAPLQPLVHIIFCWDHRSNVPRAVGYGERSHHIPTGLRNVSTHRSTANLTSRQLGTSYRKRRYWEVVDEDEQADGNVDSDDGGVPNNEQGLPTKHTPLEAYNVGDDVSLATYEASGSVVVPVQLQGVTFWQRLLHRRLLHRMTHHATMGLGGRHVAADPTAPPAKRTRSPPPPLRDMYVMTPLNHDSLQPLLTQFSPPFQHDNKCRAGTATEATCVSCELMAAHVRVRSEEVCLKRPPPVASNTTERFDDAPNGPFPERKQRRTPGRGGGGGGGGGDPRHRCEMPNIAKTLQLFEWLNRTLSKRSPLHDDPPNPSDADANDTPTAPRRLLWGSVALFDKSKGQFAGLPMGDHRHFSCHARTSLKYEPRGFYQSLSRESIQSLLSPLFMETARRRSYRNNHTSSLRRASASAFDGGPIGTAPSLRAGYGTNTLCHDTVSVQHLTSLIGVAVRGKGPILWRMQQVQSIQAIGAMAAGGARLLSQPLLPNRSPLHRRIVRRLGAKQWPAGPLQHYVVAQPSPPKNLVSIIGNGNYRCRNSGDLYLLQLMLHDAIWKRVNVTRQAYRRPT